MFKKIVFPLFILFLIGYIGAMNRVRIIENNYSQSIIAILENSLIIKDDIKEFNAIKARSLLSNWTRRNYPNKDFSVTTKEYKVSFISHLDIEFYLSLNPFLSVNRSDTYEIAGKSV